MKSVTVEPERYLDSVLLLRVTQALKAVPGIEEAVVALATPSNLEHLSRVGFSSTALAGAGPNDLVVAIDGASEDAIAAGRARLAELLSTRGDAQEEEAASPRTLRAGVRALPGANLALISVPGAHAAREARTALRLGLHVMLFSDNVSVEDEIALKDEAVGTGLLMMGPDCGTAILNGIPLGFANAVRRGSIGIVGASGTGIQEISCLVHRFGGGISQAIGTGGRDLSEAVGGRMTRVGIAALADDPKTDVLVVVSKTPAPGVGKAVLDALRATEVPAVVHFVGQTAREKEGLLVFADSLAATAALACEAAGIPVPSDGETTPRGEVAAAEGRVLGLFCGGTLCQEAWTLLTRAGLRVGANVAPNAAARAAAEGGTGHILLDLGEDRFTVGRPHPMIEPSLRDERVAAAGKDRSVAVVLTDLVLGYGAHPNPGASLAAAAAEAIATAREDGRRLAVVTSITGTDRDPQDYGRQQAALEDAGVRVAASNAQAADLARRLLKEGER